MKRIGGHSKSLSPEAPAWHMLKNSGTKIGSTKRSTRNALGPETTAEGVLVLSGEAEGIDSISSSASDRPLLQSCSRLRCCRSRHRRLLLNQLRPYQLHRLN